MQTPLEPFEVQDSESLRQIIFELRVESWKSVGVFLNDDFPADICQDEHDSHALHWVIKDDGRIVAAARMCLHERMTDIPDAGFFQGLDCGSDAPWAALNRLVVSPLYQRRGLARKLDEIRIIKARSLNCRSVLAVAPPIRWGPLERLGFELIGPVNSSAPPDWLKRLAANTPVIERRVMKLSLP